MVKHQKKFQLLKKFTEYLTHENARKDLMGRTSLNNAKDTMLISQSQQQSLFTSNQEEAGTRIAINFFIKTVDFAVSHEKLCS